MINGIETKKCPVCKSGEHLVEGETVFDRDSRNEDDNDNSYVIKCTRCNICFNNSTLKIY